jgi:uncharacterized protein (TIGR03435 family)
MNQTLSIARKPSLPVSLLLTSALCLITATAQQPSFAVATIRPSSGEVKFEHDGSTDLSPTNLRMHDVLINTCIKFAYGVQDTQIAGPGLLRSERYDITAKSDAPASEDQMKLMLQTLLADRFKLTFHRERREMRALVLTVASSGSKLKPAAAPDARPFRENSANGTIAKSMPIQEFADFISGPLQMPVVDQTGLTGKYDFAIDFTPYLPDPTKNMDGTRPDTTGILKAAMQDELGLKMDARKTDVEVMVIDHVEKPSEN